MAGKKRKTEGGGGGGGGGSSSATAVEPAKNPGLSLIDDDDMEEEENRVTVDQEAGEEDSSSDGGEELEDDKVEESKSRDKLWDDPTHDEMKGLKETELLYKSSLLRLEMNELQSEVEVDYTKLGPLEDWLHSFKSFLEKIPRSTIKDKGLDALYTVKGQQFQFLPPTQVELVGSFLLRTLVKPDLNVDMAVEMPADCLHAKDFLNGRFMYKRNMYLSHIAKALGSSGNNLVESVSFSRSGYHRGQLVLVLKPRALAGLSAKFLVKLFVCPPADFFPLQRFRPTRNNFRSQDGDIALEPPTPHYNALMAEQLRLLPHLHVLHAEFSRCQALVDAALLLKVWVRQRCLDSAWDGLNGFMLSMLLVYLVQNRTISRGMSSYHMLRAAFVFLSKRENLESGVHLTPTEEAKISVEEAMEEFRGRYPAVLLDQSLAVNVLSRLSHSAVSELTHEARAALLCLEHDLRDGFSPLMLTRVSLLCKYDEILVIELEEVEEDASGERLGGGEWKEAIGFNKEPGMSNAQAVEKAVLSVLDKALGDRMHFARVLPDRTEEANMFLSEKIAGKRGGNSVLQDSFETLEEAGGRSGWAASGRRRIFVGMLLNEETSTRKIDRGPSADDANAAKEFRKFWGNKSELRRFKDGSIQETLSWDEAERAGGRNAIPSAIAAYALKRHIPELRSSRVLGIAGSSEEILKQQGEGSFGRWREEEVASSSSFNVMDKLAKTMMSISPSKLPLPVLSLQPLSTRVRGLGALDVSVHPLAFKVGPEEGSKKRKRQEEARLRLNAESIDCVLQLQESGKWPDEVEAMRTLTSAFYLQMARCLNEMESSSFVAKAFSDHLQVLGNGYAFRLYIWNNREVKLLKAMGEKAEAIMLEEEFFHRPQHVASLVAVSQKFPAMPGTLRLCKRWVASSFLSTEVVDLEFDSNPMTNELYKECVDAAEDKGGVRWVSKCLSKMAWRRSITLAREALKKISRRVCEGREGVLQQAYRRNISSYDVVLWVKSGKSLEKSQLGENLLVGFCPLTCLLQELKEKYGRFAVFWGDTLRGDCIVVLWSPAMAAGGQLTVAHASNTFPLSLIKGARDAGEGKEEDKEVIPDYLSMLCGFKRVGEGLVSKVEVLAGARVVP
ncbi:hypothetical protein GUITHDRAFT_104301 [Guillardia theta CCMP2712]|uniref:Nucleolar protein 6 n=2 Tax=Guillardia theta TaxID=55529 RepID=L1JNQ1_GUITC|nr:hypothetical protein GUITHDRAFT_104301 [Guillardia theta CCMP2712]EKX49904.1 hypothetical protein GUITHDRAFT_104301 [Guillardia theta CCMP2712]|eukprot:XP_005836884.1 hypothetical protein GUITHDRAFT_104301 [Guillardia theta CCMP2712]